jgi:hypothetical protein
MLLDSVGDAEKDDVQWQRERVLSKRKPLHKCHSTATTTHIPSFTTAGIAIRILKASSTDNLHCSEGTQRIPSN